MQTYEHFHPGEVAVQAEWGTDTDAYEAQSRQMMRPEINPHERVFISGLTFSAAASVDADGRPWASTLFAADTPLFTVDSATSLTISPALGVGEPLVDSVRASGALGVLFFDPLTRRRAKSIGHATTDGHTFRYDMTRLFGLCPKYIYARSHEPAPKAPNGVAVTSDRLGDDDQTLLAQADTAFLASFSPHGADVTHRGGPPGFIEIVDANTLEIPDYFGNGMFNTLGNLRLDDRLALTATDFTTGRTVHMTGHAVARATGKASPEPERSITVTVEEIRVSWNSVGRWTDHGPSRYTPTR
ncbi:MAG: pyridoxamine 5'-phosphate oxidase family protein [Actinomycetota bacterium]